jgi:acyl transferase domain-containing protein
VGAVLLKPLAAALADGDRIWGVVKASAVGHGGRTNGYTVPDPVAQADVVGRAWSAAGVDPLSVGYVEAHGTGTALGDPIEVAGLARVFGGAGRGSVPIGSVKSNIGHAESAAGIAGVTKVLLQMRFGQLVPSLHAEELNPHIDFAGSVFRVQRELVDWPAGRGWPRRAGVSSFGAGGANAHVVVEEPPVVADRGDWRPVGPALVVVSAADGDRLREVVARLAGFVAGGVEVDVYRVAYTLQTGREAMAERLALRASDAADLHRQLRAYLDGEHGPWYRGSARPGAGGLGSLLAGEDARAMVARWAEQGRHDQLLQAWVHGLGIDWTVLYPNGTPQPLSLPAYPFARDRYWVTPPQPTATTSTLHPLIHRNTSTIWQQRFETTFTGAEFFLTDHRIHNRPVLPAAAEVEMAYVAVAAALAPPDDAQVRLTDLVWQRPLAVPEGAAPLTVEVDVEPRDDDTLAVTLHAAGAADEPAYLRANAYLRIAETVAPLDPAGLLARCPRPLSAEDGYARLRAAGIVHGPTMRVLRELHAGDGEAVARVELPAGHADGRFVLHPALLDAAIQAAVALAPATGRDAAADAGPALTPAVPFGLEEIAVHAPLPQRGWIWVRGRDTASGGVLDVDVAADDGQVCARLHGLELRRLAPAAAALLLTPAWLPATGTGASPDAGRARLVLTSARVPDLTGPLPHARHARLAGFGEGAAIAVAEIQRLLAQPAPDGPLIQLVVTDEPADGLLGGLHGILLTAQQEDPRVWCQLIEVPAAADAQTVGSLLEQFRQLPSGSRVRIGPDGPHVAGWRELPFGEPPAVTWRDGGVYLITGGRGGLGRLLLAEIRRRVRTATVVLVGRTAPDASDTAGHGDGVRVDHRQADVADRDAVAALVAAVVAQYGRLDGVVHAAGVLRDALLPHKTPEQIAAVLAAKVSGAWHLDEATADLPLDWFVLFGSITGVAGNPGQADYAAGNAFLDRFAEYRAGLVARGERSGHTLSIDWPLWTGGGMTVDAGRLPGLADRTGLAPMPPDEGMRSLDRAMAAGVPQVMVLYGDPARLRAAARPAGPPEPDRKPSAARLERLLVSAAAGLLRVDPADLDPETDLAEYGFEPIMFAELAERLNETYGLGLSPALLLQHPTLGGLSRRLANTHPELIGAIEGGGRADG